MMGAGNAGDPDGGVFNPERKGKIVTLKVYEHSIHMMIPFELPRTELSVYTYGLGLSITIDQYHSGN